MTSKDGPEDLERAKEREHEGRTGKHDRVYDQMENDPGRTDEIERGKKEGGGAL